MQPAGGVTYDALVGAPPTPRDAATTALVTPEVLDALLAAMAAGTSPVEAAVPLAEAFFDAYDRYFRQKIGPLPWVHHTWNGRVLAITGKTCTVRVAGLPAPVTGVLYGPSKPTVGDTYPVRFPVALPPVGQPLAPGPVPSGQPWIKVPGGGEPWLYYFGVGAATPQTTLWRVPLPGPAPFDYTAELAQEVHRLPGRPEVLNAGDLHLAGPGMVTQMLYLEESAFERVGRPELAPPSYPYPLRLHRYPQFGAAGTEAPIQVSGLPHAHVLWTNMGEGLQTDVLIGVGRRTEEEPNISPYPDAHQYHQLADLVLSRDGGATWTTTLAGLIQGRQIAYYYPAGGYYVPQGGYPAYDTRILSAGGWVLDADIPGIGIATERVDTWVATYWPDGNPYPTDIAPVPLEGNRPTLYQMEWWPVKRVLALLHVARNGGMPQRYDFNQPSGWVTQCYIRPTGGGGLRGWWQGHHQQFVVKHATPDPNFFFIEYGATPDVVWYGERPADGIWEWRRITEPAGLNRIIHCNGDGSVALVARFVGPDTVRDIDSHWLTVDAGVTWRELPLPPHFPWDPAHHVSYAMQGWLIDTP